MASILTILGWLTGLHSLKEWLTGVASPTSALGSVAIPTAAVLLSMAVLGLLVYLVSLHASAMTLGNPAIRPVFWLVLLLGGWAVGTVVYRSFFGVEALVQDGKPMAWLLLFSAVFGPPVLVVLGDLNAHKWGCTDCRKLTLSDVEELLGESRQETKTVTVPGGGTRKEVWKITERKVIRECRVCGARFSWHLPLRERIEVLPDQRSGQ